MACEGGNSIDEDRIISTLLSSEFSKFYNNEWNTRGIHVTWCYNYYLNRKAYARLEIDGEQRSYIIVFRQFPAIGNIVNDSYLFAHEMMHIVRLFDDKLLQFGDARLYDSEYTPAIEKVMLHIFEDVAVDRTLYNKYSFELLSYYEENIIGSKSNLANLEKEPYGLERKVLLLKLVKERILWNIIKNKESSTIWMNYEAWLKSECSATKTIIKDRDAIMLAIEDFEWDTPEQQKPVFKLIVDFCKLNDYICIK